MNYFSMYKSDYDNKVMDWYLNEMRTLEYKI